MWSQPFPQTVHTPSVILWLPVAAAPFVPQTRHFCPLPQVGELICRELRQAGRAGICFTETDAQNIHYVQRFEQSEKSVASLRLDGVVAALLDCARSEAAEKILQGLVSVNGFTEEKCTRQLSGGERISVRGRGKFIVLADGRVTRKGRQLIQIKRFV